MSAVPTINTGSLPGAAPDGLRRVDRLLEQAAWIMMPTGFILIILGWVGASRTPLLFEQIPYLISGGLLGLGLMIGGGLLYVGGWVARTAQLLPTDSPVAGLAAMLQGMTGAAAAVAPGNYVKTPSGSMFHRAECSIVASRDDVVEVKPSQVEKFKPCGMCDPLVAA